MDYIREELLRQQAALASLLLGKTAEEETARDEETASGEWPAEVSAQKSPAAAGAEHETEHLQKPGIGEAGTKENILPAAGPVGGGDVPAREAGGLDAEALAGPGGERMVTEVLWAGTRGMPDAKALSRTFQRDARRYDGGFRLY